jgi:outer membrane biogenesis lipoprotein LolB
VLALLTGCATTRDAVDLPVIGSWQARTDILGQVRAWEFKGRIAVKAGDDGFNARFDWSQDGEAFEARVSGPLGIGTVRIEGDGHSVTLTDKDGAEARLDDVEAELRWRYGWAIPVRSCATGRSAFRTPQCPASSNSMNRIACCASSRTTGLWKYPVTRKVAASRCRAS